MRSDSKNKCEIDTAVFVGVWYMYFFLAEAAI